MTHFNVYIPGTTMFAHSSCCLHIPLAHPCLYYYLLSPQYTVLHILFHCTFYPLFFFLFLFYSYLYLYIYYLVLCFIISFLHCPLSRPVLIYISLLIISCIIEYVMNKRTLNPWTLIEFPSSDWTWTSCKLHGCKTSLFIQGFWLGYKSVLLGSYLVNTSVDMMQNRAGVGVNICVGVQCGPRSKQIPVCV